MRVRAFLAAICCLFISSCGCSKYASDFTCSFVEKSADYEVWYWQNLENDNEADNKMIGHATGLKQCESNARIFALATGEEFQDRAYICILMIDGSRMEKHRNLISINE